LIADAPAKINLGLDILRRREDGFHELKTLFLAVDLSDRLEAFAAPNAPADTLTVSGKFADGVPTTPDNLVLRAIAALRGAMVARGRGREALRLRIQLDKRVPHGAGLGGGSSDAAAALRLASGIWRAGFADAELSAIAGSIGSDCAFFVRGGAAMGTGRGEILESVEVRRAVHVVFAMPAFGVSTREAYGGLSAAEDFGEKTDFARMAAWLGGADGEMPTIHNAFTRSVASRHPEIARIIAAFRERGAFAAEMSGSGSVCFGLFDGPPPVSPAIEGCMVLQADGASYLR